MPSQSPNIDTKNTKENSLKKSRTLTLVLTRNCNLNCSYCYEKQFEPVQGFMELGVAQDAITRIMERDDEYDTVFIDLFGGEPLLAFPLIKKIYTWCRSQEWKKDYRFMVGTNGTLLNDEMKEFFSSDRRYFAMALSIDGNRTVHNLNRDNSYDLVYPHIPFFKENWPDQPAKMTIYKATIPYLADSIIELEEMGLYFTANLAFDNFWGSPIEKEDLLQVYEEQLERLTDYYIQKDWLFPVYPLLGIMPVYLGISGYKGNIEKDCVRYCGAGHEMTTVDIDGTMYPCHRFLHWVTGKPAPTGLTNRQTFWKPDKCASCKIVFSCPTCAGFNWQENHDTGIRTTYHCEAHQLEVLASAKIAAHRFKKIPISELAFLSPELRRELNVRARMMRELIENGI